ncbi:hypothetical protein AMJ85_05280 [candidate division BRC1 bacterium SM23_51]|nr:MAG: hypothetical protein AMJ85_05280 [candidate division BRC1 bacterium SM23_51]
MAKETELKGRVSIEGAEEGAQKLKKVSGAQAEVAEGAAVSTEATKAQAAAQDGLNASESDFISLLAAASPALGRWVDGLLKGVKVASEHSIQFRSLGGAISKATEFIKAHAGAMTLLGAGSAALMALLGLKKRWEEIEEQIQKAYEAQKRFNEEATKQKAEQIALEEEVFKATERQREAVSAADQRRAAEVAKMLVRKGIEPATAIQVAGAMAGPLLAEGGEGLSAEELLILGQAAETGAFDVSEEFAGRFTQTKRAMVERFLRSRRAEKAREQIQAADEIARIRAEQARRQLRSGALVDEFGRGKLVQAIGPTAELEALIEELYGPQENMDRLVAQLIALQAFRAEGLQGPEQLRRLQAETERRFGEGAPLTTEEAIKVRNMLDQLTGAGAIERRARTGLSGGLVGGVPEGPPLERPQPPEPRGRHIDPERSLLWQILTSSRAFDEWFTGEWPGWQTKTTQQPAAERIDGAASKQEQAARQIADAGRMFVGVAEKFDRFVDSMDNRMRGVGRQAVGTGAGRRDEVGD